MSRETLPSPPKKDKPHMLTTVVKWMEVNTLKVNANKTEVMLVGKPEVLKGMSFPLLMSFR